MSSAYDTLILSEANLLAYWPLNDSSSPAVDATGNGHSLSLATGVATGTASLLPADSETAMTWQNTVSSDSVVTSAGAFAVATPCVEFFVDYASVLASGNMHLWRSGEFPNGGFGVGTHNGSWLFTTYARADNVFSSGPTAGTIYYVVMSLDAQSNGNCKLWINGTLQQTLTGVSITPFSDAASVGGSNLDGTWIKGVLQKFAVYSAPLTQAQITNHWNASQITPIAVSDSAAGTDTPSLATIAPAISDAAGGTEGIGIAFGGTIPKPVSDAAAGADAVAIGVVLSDSASGGHEGIVAEPTVPFGGPGYPSARVIIFGP